MAAFKVATKNVEDARARAIGMHKGGNLALKAKVVEHEEERTSVETTNVWWLEEVKYAYSDHMAFYAKDFWNDSLKAKANLDKRHNANGRRTSGPKMRVCYNCDDKFHFVAECPYERREDHNGRLVLKDKSKITKKKPFVKKEEIQQEANTDCAFKQTRRVLNRRKRN